MFMIFFLLACFILVGKALVRNSQNQIDVLTRNLGTSFQLKLLVNLDYLFRSSYMSV